MILETDRLRLRLPEMTDAEAAGELLADPDVMRFIGGEVVPREAWPAVVEKWIVRWEENDVGPFVVERDGAFVGRVGIIVWDVRTWTQSTFRNAGAFAQPELGWAFARAAWGNGYATEAARAVLEWARRERGLDALVSVISPQNVRSQRVAQRLGATPAETVPLYDSGPAVVWRYPR